ncbi:hypothetical protein C2W58_02440 [Bacillus pumilus]|uniref:Uncharacterized protein n=1 Tax=Bacillus pumilus TaxID=1408 RepID=A0AB34QYB3_BACPU|nr:hypothetical protein B4127_2974 [Bacillus pumilus]RAP14339.1 hypothetical protein C2W58_02440 [Bacillus pumilus]
MNRKNHIIFNLLRHPSEKEKNTKKSRQRRQLFLRFEPRTMQVGAFFLTL